MTRRTGAAGRERGAVLVIALIVLVAMTLAAIALVRSVDAANMVAGNFAFKQGATAAGDAGTEAAISWLQTVVGTSDSYEDNVNAGYYATSQDEIDYTGNSRDETRALVDWDFNKCNDQKTSACIKPAKEIAVGNGNKVSYIIHRLCLSAGDPNAAANSCANFRASGTGSPKRGELKYGDDKRFEGTPAEYYRITTRVKGPRNTTSYVETIVHF
ncbi:MAG TPA: pilus assembly PilX N-terminal domain-containing protein [Paucimonas sp.]|nr:pilus assembly PilX N-terminal domain-containing protein [Paucimonas sp.]